MKIEVRLMDAPQARKFLDRVDEIIDQIDAGLLFLPSEISDRLNAALVELYKASAEL